MSTLSNRLALLGDALQLSLVQGVSNEIVHFAPEGWSWEVRDGAFLVTGWSDHWLHDVRKLSNVLAYKEGCILRRLAEGHYEFTTWRDQQGTGFKVVFKKTEEPVSDVG